MVTRVMLLFSLAWIIRLTKPWFTVVGTEISGRDLILILGGLFLMAKSTHRDPRQARRRGRARVEPRRGVVCSVIIQIMLLDIVFSLDSVITAVGMVDELWVMVTAVIIAVGIMMWSAEPISAFVHRHPTVKMLALSFLLLIGVSLLAEGFDHHIPKGYIYFAMGFSVFVESINLRLRRKAYPSICTSPTWRTRPPGRRGHSTLSVPAVLWHAVCAGDTQGWVSPEILA